MPVTCFISCALQRVCLTYTDLEARAQSQLYHLTALLSLVFGHNHLSISSFGLVVVLLCSRSLTNLVTNNLARLQLLEEH
jgi:hypothetical protein